MVTTGSALSLNAQICEKSTKESRQRLFLYCSILKRSSGTCINDSRPGLYVDAGSSLPGPEDPHERLSGEDAGCFTHLYIKQSFSFFCSGILEYKCMVWYGLTSMIMRTVGRVAAKFCGCGGLTVTGMTPA